MTITLFELAGANPDDRFGPHCWKSRIALAHKKVAYHTEPVSFTEKEKIAFSGQPLLPALKHNDTAVSDSFTIASYLDEQFPESPQLFIDDQAKDDAKEFNQWADTELAKHIRPAIIMPIFNLLSDTDKAYFRSTREAKLGVTLESCEEKAEEGLNGLLTALQPVNAVLIEQPFLGGDNPSYKDICLFGLFLWLATTRGIEFLKADAVTYAWYQAMVKQYANDLPATVVASAA